MNRREALKAGTLIPVSFGVSGMAGGALATCGSSGIQIDPTVLVAINNAVAQACNFIPTVTTVIAIVDALFPAVNGATSVAEGVIGQIAGTLCKGAPSLTPAGKLGGRTVTAGGSEIPVHGWVVENGKLTYV
jgi:hypothetical protein